MEPDSEAPADPLKARVELAFGGRDSGFADKYLDYLVNRHAAAVDGTRRNGILVLVVIGLNELLVRTDVTEISFLGFKVDNLSFVVVLLPVIAAFQVYEEWAGLAHAQILRHLIWTVISHAHPPVARENLWSEILVPHPTLFGSDIRQLGDAPLSYRIADGVFRSAVAFALFLAPVLYLLWTVFVRTPDFDAPTWLKVSAMIGTVIFVAYGGFQLVEVPAREKTAD